MTQLRIDIQALRGIAVLAVLFFHAEVIPDSGGYLGVDVFFVISGFLITSQICNGIEAGTFSFRTFYLRRAWRLLPAAYAVFAACLIASPWLLNDIERYDFYEQLLGAIGLFANHVLWGQTGYFETSAEVKPLLHAWSLSLEEQYYLILPLLLVMIRRTLWLPVAAVLTVTSFALLSAKIEAMPGATFYLLPTRVWELGIGSIAAIAFRKQTSPLPSWLCWPALLVLAAILYKPLPLEIHNEVNLLIATLAAVIIILTQNARMNQLKVFAGLAKFGTISYALYLVHWPLFAALHNLNVGGGGLSWQLRLAAILASIVLAAALYAGVEQRFRLTHKRAYRPAYPLLICSLILAVVTASLYFSHTSESDYRHRFRVNSGLSLICGTPDFETAPECRTHPDPEILVWGDSFAMHLVPGLVAQDEKLIQATMSTCPPLDHVALYAPPEFPVPWSRDCVSFNQRAKNLALTDPSISTVILGAQWSYMFGAGYHDGRNTHTNLDVDTIARNLHGLAQEIRQAGKSVIIVEPPPILGFDIGRCHERLERGLLRMGGTESCDIPVQAYRAGNKLTDGLFDQLVASGLPTYSFADHLCDDHTCVTKIGNRILYRDVGHLSIEGSEYLLNQYPITGAQ